MQPELVHYPPINIIAHPLNLVFFNFVIGMSSFHMQLSTTNAGLGFTLQETAQSYTALAGGFVDFRGLSQQNRVELAQTVTELQAIGINADLAKRIFHSFQKLWDYQQNNQYLFQKNWLLLLVLWKWHHPK